MIQNTISKYSSLFLICILPAFLVGCEGGTGDIRSGEAVSKSADGESLPDLSGKVSNVSISSGSVTVDFYLEDKNGAPVTGHHPGFTIAQLQEATAGEPTKWQNYINATQTVGSEPDGWTNITSVAGVQPVGTSAIQPTYENSAKGTGTFVDNGDGSYTYTYDVVLTNVTSPLAVSYDPSLTHRVGIQVGERGGPVANLIYDFRPAGGIVNTTRKIVKIESCNECHGQLKAMHGGNRIDVDYCVVCHNPGNSDPHSGNSLLFTNLIHKLHSGSELPSVKAGGEFAIYGYRNSKHDYSELGLPMDIRNCRKCHDENDAETPDANQWRTIVTMEACGSCHDGNETFDNTTSTSSHYLEPLSNTSCISGCHETGGLAGNVEENHIIDLQVESKKFRYNILDVYSTAQGQYPRVIFSVTDPTQGSFFYNITTDSPFKPDGGSVNIRFAWSTTDYTNTGTDSSPATAMSQDAIANALPNGDGTYTLTSASPIPASATGSGAVFMEGRPKVYISGKKTSIPVKNTIQYFPITDATAYIRRKIVDIEKCYKCHESVSMHGSNRNDNLEVCVACHNPNNTDAAVRPYTTLGVDGKQEEAIQFAWMIHSIHAGDKDEHGVRADGIVVYGHMRTPGNYVTHDFSHVRFPNQLSKCTICHDGDSYALPISDDAKAVTFHTGTSIASKDDDTLRSPTASACYACHDNDTTQTHMETYGGEFYLSRTEADNREYDEVCVSCHGPGGTVDLKEVLGL